jgi:hypothetical protein
VVVGHAGFPDVAVQGFFGADFRTGAGIVEWNYLAKLGAYSLSLIDG